MTVKLQTELHLEFLSLNRGCIGSSESEYHIVVNHMLRLKYALLVSLIRASSQQKVAAPAKPQISLCMQSDHCLCEVLYA